MFPRLVWSSLAVALLVGTVQTGLQLAQATPLILAAEAYEEVKDQKAEIHGSLVESVDASSTVPVQSAAAHEHDHDHEHSSIKDWEPENGFERMGWTWVANSLHAFSMALLVFAVMGVWRHQRGTVLTAMQLSGFVAAAGWLSFYLWPAMGLPAEVPGTEAAPLRARQLWTALAIGCAAAACSLTGFRRATWRWPVAAVLLAIPFIVGAPHLQGDSLGGHAPESHAALAQLKQQFFWATTWVALSFWLSMGLSCGLVFQRWLQPVLVANFAGGRPSAE